MSSRRERRKSENDNPLIGIRDYFGSENVSRGKGKKKSKKNAKGQTKLSRQPLGELQSNITETCGGLPEIRVKVADSGCLQVDCETSEVTTQTDSSCVASDNKMTQTEEPVEQSVHYRMCTEETPPIEYWQELAEQRRKALIETLEENKQLYEEIEELKTILRERNERQQESVYFSYMYKLAKDENC